MEDLVGRKARSGRACFSFVFFVLFLFIFLGGAGEQQSGEPQQDAAMLCG